MLKKLNQKNISKQTRPIKVLQFGEGNFLRAFADWIIDILNEKAGFNGNIHIVQPIQNGMGDKVKEQDGLYHVVLNGIANQKPVREIRLITCVDGVTNPFVNFQAYLDLAVNPDLKFIISNTTEAGIVFNPKDTNPEVLSESFPGKLTTLLYHRFKMMGGSPQSGLILLPCELVEKNGQLLRTAILQYINHWQLPDAFKKWITESNTFCNTLVDRIVPGFPRETISEIQHEIGFEDNLVVMAEPFHLWVIEGPSHVQEALPTTKAGLQVIYAKDLTPYRTRKVRILNGAHTAMVPVAYLNGLRTVRESIEDPKTGEFMRKLIFEEIIPTLDLPESELKKFADDVIERFQNPFIKHELSSIALNSISKFKVRVLPSILKYAELKNTLPGKLLYSLACLIRFYKGDWKGQQVPVADTPEIVQFFNAVWENGTPEEVVQQTLANTSFWDQDLTKIDGLKDAVVHHLRDIEVNA